MRVPLYDMTLSLAVVVGKLVIDGIEEEKRRVGSDIQVKISSQTTY